jgi:hypothetical protein
MRHFCRRQRALCRQWRPGRGESGPAEKKKVLLLLLLFFFFFFFGDT